MVFHIFVKLFFKRMTFKAAIVYWLEREISLVCSGRKSSLQLGGDLELAIVIKSLILLLF